MRRTRTATATTTTSMLENSIKDTFYLFILASQPPETKTEDEPWYHGDIGRRQAEGLCVRDGDYIVRHSGARGFVLTTKWLTQPKHFIIQEDEEVKGDR